MSTSVGLTFRGRSCCVGASSNKRNQYRCERKRPLFTEHRIDLPGETKKPATRMLSSRAFLHSFSREIISQEIMPKFFFHIVSLLFGEKQLFIVQNTSYYSRKYVFYLLVPFYHIMKNLSRKKSSLLKIFSLYSYIV